MRSPAWGVSTPARIFSNVDLPAPFGPDQHDALAALGLEIHAAIDHVFAVGLVDVLELDDPQAAALRLGKLEIQRASVGLGRVDLVHALDLLELALGLGGLGVLGAEAVDELHQARDLAFLMLVGGEELLLVGFALLEVLVVVAAVTDQAALANFDDAADELVQKLAVVRDDENRAGIGLQVVLEPQQRFEVEVIGRLVEQQQVGLLRRAAGPGARA